MRKTYMAKKDKAELASEARKRFTVYIDCEHEEFQGKNFAFTTGRALMRIVGKIAEGKLSGPITLDGATVGNWTTEWRNEDPANRRPKRDKSKLAHE
jgi:hypothetical protein